MKKFTDTDLTKYFIETVNEYQEVFDQAKNKYEVADSQTEINELVELLKTRYEALVNKAEYKVQLNNLILAWDGKDLSEYKESGVINLNKALDSAKIVYDNDDASKQEVDQVIEALNDAINVLEKIDVEDQANKLALQIAVEVADKVTDKDLENVVPAVVNEFKAALANAKAVLDDANATQEQADTAFDRLANAMHMLEFFKGNKTDLDKLVTQIESLNRADYSEVSWNAMLLVLDEAKDVLANENAMQEEVDEAYTELIKAFLELRLKPNKDLLQELINKANGLNAADYTAKSWQALQKEVEKASKVVADPKADYETVEKAIESLKGSIEALEEKTPEVLDGKENAIKTGDSNNMSQLGVVMLLAGAAVVTLRRKKIEE